MLLEILLIFLSLFLYLYYNITKQFDFFKSRGIPQLIPSFPFGSNNAKEVFTGKVSIVKIDRAVASAYPNEKVVGYFMLGQPIFVINDAELAKKMLVKDFDYFMDRRDIDSNDKITAMFLTSLKGTEWRQMRAMMSGVFTSGKLKLMTKHLVKVGLNFEQHITELAEKGNDVCMKDIGGLMTLDSIASAGYGIETNSFKNPQNKFRVMAMTLVGAPEFVSRFRFLGLALMAISPRLSKLLNLKFMPSEPVEYFSNILKTTQKQRMESGARRNDVIDLIVDEMKSNKAKTSLNESFESEFEKDAAIDTKGLKSLAESGYDEETLLISNALLFFFAGFDTTSTGLAIICHKLALYPNYQNKLLEELDSVVWEEDEVTFETLLELKYMDAFINETYRFSPILDAHERLCTKDYKVPDMDLTIPKGRFVKIFTEEISRKEEYFKNPKEFDPDNFLPENKPNKFGLQIFGHGPRNCIGMRYANLTIKVDM